ncbi:unnamed protein product, partial [Pylaiella littoralis]
RRVSASKPWVPLEVGCRRVSGIGANQLPGFLISIASGFSRRLGLENVCQRYPKKGQNCRLGTFGRAFPGISRITNGIKSGRENRDIDWHFDESFVSIQSGVRCLKNRQRSVWTNKIRGGLTYIASR